MGEIQVPKGVTLSTESDARRLIEALELAKEQEGITTDTEAILVIADFYVSQAGTPPAGNLEALLDNEIVENGVEAARTIDDVRSVEDAIEAMAAAYVGF